ncbi:MAG: hypothetical protein A3J54_03000 [Candidatus Ryanbacteria bacterium RIFCSPHIGHO2_02_FULL_45_13b]|uniref:Nucleoid-associated protein, YbaB/EbfC family n=1 Tax=Candidatus Ryanbacteria bacterium RIFCSPHIGHO2_02_FULL_45_13b TaxID=1802117 RepID=A0A1G2G6R5_9BACT|nr:MAG: hypothetical protein A3J54_03000 [Candidatus Ryanbacteria bacterium RIFCSPHIGHO2_02_FULL_45_13b]
MRETCVFRNSKYSIKIMFDKLKDMYQMQKQAREMQALLGAERAVGSSKDGVIQITLSGSFDVVDVVVTDGAQLTKDVVQKDIKEAFTDAQQKVKGILMQKFKGMV